MKMFQVPFPATPQHPARRRKFLNHNVNIVLDIRAQLLEKRQQDKVASQGL
jgi:hypothetical protein